MALIENTLFGVVDKVQVAIDRIRQFEPPEGYWVGFSGGKDSCVLKDLVLKAGVKAEFCYSLTTVDPPELVQFIRQHHPDVTIKKPKLSMWQLIEKKYGPPTRTMRYCCDVLKEQGGKRRTVLLGIRWEESARRAQRPLYEDGRKDKKIIILPIADWTLLDIWNYIDDNNLPYCSLYDEGWDRIGCIMCPLAGHKHMQIQAERWPTYAKMYRIACHKAWANSVAKGKRKEGEGKLYWDGDSLYEWWISEIPKNIPDPNQEVIF
jgi:phosphoadenosine phosphosulfate reductase